ncbi:hypothetical protein Q7C36_001440 [Tachysurus vachellii]|uniref:Uncharacterized protein n=1 Tax=Tachysurus vachellii TaxID=175792 RepID=A0AA88TBC7_TACVA|nr:hypothetical protein Q7C36_001440 [Tachysurus vachellii]
MRSVPIILLNSSPEEQENSVPLEEFRCSSSLPLAFPLHSTPSGGISAPILHFPTTPESCSAPPQNSDSVSHSQCLQNSCWFFCASVDPRLLSQPLALRKNVPENSWQEKSQRSSPSAGVRSCSCPSEQRFQLLQPPYWLHVATLDL